MSSLQNITALFVFLPLLSASLCTFFSTRTSYYATIITSTLLIACSVLGHINLPESGYISYSFGGWEAPFGIEYRLDYLSITFTFLSGLLLGLAAIFSWPVDNRKYFYQLLLVLDAGFNALLLSYDLFNIFVFLEVTSLATCGLIALSKDKKSLISAFNYLLISTVAASLFLLGTGLLYIATGSLNITDLSNKVSSVYDSFLVRSALAFMVIAILIKTGTFPIHSWLASIYKNSNPIVGAISCSLGGAVLLNLLIKITLLTFGKEFSYEKMPLFLFFSFITIIGILYFSVKALFTKNSFDSYIFYCLSQSAYILLLIAICTQKSLIAAIIYIFNSSVIKFFTFLFPSVIHEKPDVIATKTNLFSLSFLILNLAVVGFPLTNGFISKFIALESLAFSEAFMFFILFLAGFILTFFMCYRVMINFYSAEHILAKNLKSLPLISIIIIILLGVTAPFQIELATKSLASIW